ncbi:MAG: hypothetical protein H6649_05035 [Caldilineae bacterium]|nr:hypothetical protein [Caldilineae bacterium]
MISLEAQTALTSDEIIVQADHFFGPDGLGLEVSNRQHRQITFSGGGGSVVVSAARTAPDNPTTVTVVAREWEAAARRFLSTLPGPRSAGWLDRLRELFR